MEDCFFNNCDELISHLNVITSKSYTEPIPHDVCLKGTWISIDGKIPEIGGGTFLFAKNNRIFYVGKSTEEGCKVSVLHSGSFVGQTVTLTIPSDLKEEFIKALKGYVL